MIRRDICLADGAAGWMLVSQVEHARVSAVLASHCTAGLALRRAAREEVLAAIRHHDDGWIDWEQAPQLDPKQGRPLAFTELAGAEARRIWSRSIEAAKSIGPLAAWLVAGHFLRLAGHSETAQTDPQAASWCAQADVHRRDWFAQWQRIEPATHTRDVADEALQWLWTFDEASLWLCCTCSPTEPIPCAPQPYRAGRGTPVEMALRVSGPHAATAEPWRFDEGSLSVSIAGLAVPAAAYVRPGDLLAAAAPSQFSWQLHSAENFSKPGA